MYQKYINELVDIVILFSRKIDLDRNEMALGLESRIKKILRSGKSIEVDCGTNMMLETKKHKTLQEADNCHCHFR